MRLALSAIAWIAMTVMAAAWSLGCGGDAFPVDAAAKVDDTVISTSDVDRFVRAVMASQGLGPHYFDPPDYRLCVAQGGGSRPRDAMRRRLERRCRDELRAQQLLGVHALVRGEWVKREAARRSIHASDAEIDRALQIQRAELARAGLTSRLELTRYGLRSEDLRSRVRATMLEAKLLEAVRVSDREITDFYRRHKRQLAHPEQRDLHLVLAKSERQAMNARRAVAAGQDWEQVATRYSTGPLASGGVKITFYEGSGEDKALERAVFSARMGDVEGPVRTPSGWALFDVTEVRPGVRPLAQSRDEITYLLRNRKLNRRLHRGYGGETRCAQRYQVPRVPECDEPPRSRS